MPQTGHTHTLRARLAGLGLCCALWGISYPLAQLHAQPEGLHNPWEHKTAPPAATATPPGSEFKGSLGLRDPWVLHKTRPPTDAEVADDALAPVPPLIDVYTMGPGDDLFSRFGHAAICVTDAQSPGGRCYNYGTADFSTPGPLTWSFVRGRAMFWVSVVAQPYMVAIYQHEDRTLWRQRLPLRPDAARTVAKLLHLADVREATFYRYHHFNDNCTTRIRDLIDQALGGALRRDTQVPSDPPLRHYVHQGFAGQPLLLMFTELLLGRTADRPTTRWQGMFLPEILRSELLSHLGAQPEVVYARQKPLLIGASLGGSWLLVPSGLLVALLAWGLASVLRRPRLGAVLVGLKLGLTALMVTGLAACAALPELRYNEALLICLPTDLLLLGLSPRWVVRYARLRLVGLLLGALGLLAGVLVQPLWPVVVFYALPLTVLALRPMNAGEGK